MATIVTNPTARDVHVNVPLTNFSQKYMQDESSFVAMRAFPNMPVEKDANFYYVFDRDDFFRNVAKPVADGTESPTSSFKLSTESYRTEVWKDAVDVTDRQRANQDTPIMYERSAMQLVTRHLLIAREHAMVTNLFSPNLWFNGGTSASAGQNVNWSAANSTPISDIRSAIDGVHGITGYRPNKMLIGRIAYSTLLDNDDVLSRITGGAMSDNPAIVQSRNLAALFELEEIFVMNGVSNSAAEGATANTGLIGTDNALIYYAPSTTGLDQVTAGVQFSWTGLLGATGNGMRILRFSMDHLGADRVQGEMAFDFKLTGPALGHFFTSVSS